MYIILRTISLLFALVYSPLSLCQESKVGNQPTGPEAAESKALVAKTVGFSTPLTIEQIRSNITATSAADRFEFLRNQRKTTLDAIASVSTQLAATEARLKVVQTNRAEWDTSRFASAQSSRRPISKQQLQDNIKVLAEDFKQNSKKFEDVKSKSISKQDVEAAREVMLRSQISLSDTQSDLNLMEQSEKREADRLLKLKAADDEMARLGPSSFSVESNNHNG